MTQIHAQKNTRFHPVLLALLFYACINTANAQYFNETSAFLNGNNNWMFRSTGLAFNSGGPSIISANPQMNGDEGHASVSDRATGTLLFYSNGGNIWNASGQIMPNGSGLLGNHNGTVYALNNYTTLQGTLIVPFIENTDKYYVFSLSTQGVIRDINGLKGSLFYNVVDMSLDNGNGDVESQSKNIVLDTSSLSEAMIAIPGCQNDIWVLVHSYEQQEKVYKAYHVTAAGIDHTPVISASKVNGSALAGLSVSPDRTKILFSPSDNPLEISTFDTYTGRISNSITLAADNNEFMYRSSAFSPDNSKVYITRALSTPAGRGVLQYDVSVLDSAGIEASKYPVGAARASYIRLFRDTIYFTDYASQGTIHRINQPNNSGAACDLQMSAIIVPSTHNIDLNNQVAYPMYTQSNFTGTDTLVCSGWSSGIRISAKNTHYPGPYLWNTGATTPEITISTPGVYWVQYGTCDIYADTLKIGGSDLSTSISPAGNTLTATGGPFTGYQWYFNGSPIPGAVNATHTITENGLYAVEVTDDYGCIFRTDNYRVNNLTVSKGQLAGSAVRIYPNPATERIYIDAPIPVNTTIKSVDGRILHSMEHQLSVNIGELAAGIYYITIRDLEGQLLKTEKIVKRH